MAPQISSEAALSRSGAVSRQGPANQVSRALTSSHKQQSVAHAYAVASIQQVQASHDLLTAIKGLQRQVRFTAQSQASTGNVRRTFRHLHRCRVPLIHFPQKPGLLLEHSALPLKASTVKCHAMLWQVVLWETDA